MPLQESYERFRKHDCCVVIPAHNEENTLGGILERVLKYTDQVVVVDDASDDRTREILDRFPGILIIRLDKNRGKGYALKQGFAAAENWGYQYAITLDATGRHDPDDLPKFLDVLDHEHGMLVIGTDRPVKKKPSGNVAYRFWFWLQTGVKIRDTRSGYRLYPLERIAPIKSWANRFQFEKEVLIRCAWHDVPFRTIRVSGIAPQKTRIRSYSRLIFDFFLIIFSRFAFFWMAMLYQWPRNFVRSINRENIRLFVINHLMKPGESNFRKAAAVSIGFFIAVSPFWGWHSVIALGLSSLLKLNKVITVVVSSFSIPPLVPIILWGSYKVGGFIFPHSGELSYKPSLSFEFIKSNLLQYLSGSILLGLILAVISGLVVFALLKLIRKSY